MPIIAARPPMKRQPHITFSILLLVTDSFIAHFLPLFDVEPDPRPMTRDKDPRSDYFTGTISMMSLLLYTMALQTEQDAYREHN
jgi:hypothetical protein